MTTERLQRTLARVGFGSRRICEELIAEGRVTVNGRVAELGRKIDPEKDQVSVDGAEVGIRPDLVYYLLNKPVGVISTAADPQGRPTVVSLVPSEPRVFAVGRLDAESEGLLLLTNDGELTFRLTHPSFTVGKEYLAWVEGTPSRGALRRLREGVELDDGITAPARVAAIQPDLLRITIHEGRNRQIRRMCDTIGHPVKRLVRVRIGSLSDHTLAPGAWRALGVEEVRELSATPRPEPISRRERRASSASEPPN